MVYKLIKTNTVNRRFLSKKRKSKNFHFSETKNQWSSQSSIADCLYLCPEFTSLGGLAAGRKETYNLIGIESILANSFEFIELAQEI